MTRRVPFPNCRSGVIGLAITGNPENDGQLSPWQEAVGHEIIWDTHKNGCANEATTGLTLGLYMMLLQDLVFGCRPPNSPSSPGPWCWMPTGTYAT
jgi:hypothetical protein